MIYPYIYISIISNYLRSIFTEISSPESPNFFGGQRRRASRDLDNYDSDFWRGGGEWWEERRMEMEGEIASWMGFYHDIFDDIFDDI